MTFHFRCISQGEIKSVVNALSQVLRDCFQLVFCIGDLIRKQFKHLWTLLVLFEEGPDHVDLFVPIVTLGNHEERCSKQKDQEVDDL
jgi:hypothetical protein